MRDLTQKKHTFIHTGVSGFPFGTASVYRCISLYAMLKSDNNEIIILNKKAIHSKELEHELEKTGSVKGLKYIYTTPSPFLPSSRLMRAYYKIFGPLSEFITLIKLRVRKNVAVIFYYPTGSFLELLYYSLISKIFFSNFICHYVEFRSSFKSRSNKWKKLNDRLFDAYFMYFIDGSIPISSFLKNHVAKRKTIPMIKIPPVADFEKIIATKTHKNGNYFLYVGSAAFIEAIELILAAFDRIDDRTHFLYLVLNGPGVDAIKDKIKSSNKRDMIKVFSALDYSNLIGLMKGARALLIPLNEKVQDKARFPNKVAEYLAAGRPMITNEVGDISEYFQHMKNAIIAKKDECIAFADALQFVIDNPEISDQIGKSGHITGLKNFSTQSQQLPFKMFINQFINN